jgi:hypothetical protein
VDDAGKDVGTFVPGSVPAVILEVEGTWVQIGLTEKAFTTCSASGFCGWYYFEDATCSGTPLTDSNGGLVQDAVVVDDGTIRYPAGPVAAHEVNSLQLPGGGCLAMPGTQTAAEVKSSPLSTLGLTAPFHLAK